MAATKTILVIYDHNFFSPDEMERLTYGMKRRGYEPLVVRSADAPVDIRIWDLDKLEEGVIEELRELILKERVNANGR